MNSPPLPFRHLQVPAKHLEWFHLANAGEYDERKAWFYPFKSRFLYTHALPDGYDLQVIVRKCYCGDGIFRGIDHDRPRCFWEMCHRCDGTGIHDKKRVYLRRWLLAGAVYHEPATIDAIGPNPTIHETFEGYIKHEAVSPKVARRAMLRLMLRYEPRTAFAYLRARWTQLRRRPRALLNRLDRWLDAQMPGQPEYIDPIPF